MSRRFGSNGAFKPFVQQKSRPYPPTLAHPEGYIDTDEHPRPQSNEYPLSKKRKLNIDEPALEICQRFGQIISKLDSSNLDIDVAAEIEAKTFSQKLYDFTARSEYDPSIKEFTAWGVALLDLEDFIYQHRKIQIYLDHLQANKSQYNSNNSYNLAVGYLTELSAIHPSDTIEIGIAGLEICMICYG
ncbi:MAG: hypothetical protein COA94_09045 [Rickettsiales bacterium]|nr:MAG: hypothetical protein COA94_09045 [Rickettsiales bacterium]